MKRAFSAALLAGGTSTRMGRDKAFLQVGERPLWQVQLEKLRTLGPRKLMISANRAQDFKSDAEVVVDEREECGPMGGLLSCLRACAPDRLLVLGVDMPRMTSEFLGMIVARESGIVCRCDAFFEPLAAVYPAGIVGEVETRLAAGDLSMQHLVRALADKDDMDVRVSGDEERAFFENWNEPEDVHHA